MSLSWPTRLVTAFACFSSRAAVTTKSPSRPESQGSGVPRSEEAEERWNHHDGRKLRDYNREDTMGIISWIVVGLIAGFIGSKIVNKTGEGLVRDIILGIVGAFVGG